MSTATDILAAWLAAWRDYVTDGVASTGENEAKKSEIRAVGAAVAAAVADLDGAIVDLTAALVAAGAIVVAASGDLPAGTGDAAGIVTGGSGAGIWARIDGVWTQVPLTMPGTVAGQVVTNTADIAALAGDVALKANSADLGGLAALDLVNTAQITDGSVTGPKLGAASVTTAKVADKAVTYAKLQDVAAGRILGRRPGTAGPVQEIAPADARADLGVPSTTETAEAIDTAVAGEAAARTTAIGAAADSIVSYIRTWRRLGVRPGLTLGGRVGAAGPVTVGRTGRPAPFHDTRGGLRANLRDVPGIPALSGGAGVSFTDRNGNRIGHVDADGRPRMGLRVARAFRVYLQGGDLYAKDRDGTIIRLTTDGDLVWGGEDGPFAAYHRATGPEYRIPLWNLPGISTLRTHFLLVASVGQSNGAGEGGIDGIDEAVLSSMVTSWRDGILVHGRPHTSPVIGLRTDERAFEALVPAREEWRQTQMTSIAEFIRRSEPSTTHIHLAAHDVSGQAIAVMQPGQWMFENLVRTIIRAWVIAKLRGMSFEVCIPFDQGEADSLGTLENYKTKFLAMHAGLLARLAPLGITTVKFITNQISSYGRYIVQSGTVQAQLELARDHPDKVICIGPSYGFPYVDGLHRTAAGNRMKGSMVGRAWMLDRAGTPEAPVYVTGAQRNGTSVVLNFSGSSGVLKNISDLAEGETDIVTDPGNHGIKYYVAGTDVAVSSVARTGDRQYTLTLAAAPAGGSVEEVSIAGRVAAVPIDAGPTVGPRTDLFFRTGVADREGVEIRRRALHQLITPTII